MADVLKPMIRYVVIEKIATKHIHSIAGKTIGITLPGMYISQSSKLDEELPILEKIQKHGRDRGIIIGDLNGGHKRWDTKPNSRGQRLYEQAKDNQYNSSAPKNPTQPRRGAGVSKPDTALRKEVAIEGVTALPVGELKGRDHQHI